jgi:alpha-D-ribose 1-methylphosphonate 5-triphosphate synthase subunit PhnG
MNLDQDQVLCECAKDRLINFVSQLESKLTIEIVLSPKLVMTMVQAEDSIDFQPFYVGEVLMTECQLLINGAIGYGYCMGDAPQRAYAIAVIDALSFELNSIFKEEVAAFIENEKSILTQQKLEEYNQILRTKVDFKIMEQA